MNPLGLAEVTITLKLIDGTFVNFEFNLIVVEELPADILLGNNFNTISNLTIKCRKKEVKCGGKLVIKMTDEQNKSIGNIHCSEKTRIPKRTLALIDINSNKQLIKKNESLFIYANDQLYNLTKINVKNMILKPRKSIAMLQVANLNNFDIEINKGTILAKYEIIKDEDIIEFDFNEKNSKKTEIDCIINNENKFKEEFEENDFEDKIETDTIELFNGEINIGKKLTKEQKNEIINLLKEYPNLWTFDDEIIGDIKNYEHKIPTGNAKPIAQAPARCSFKEMELIDKEVEKLLKIGVIRPSNSPWAARTVMIIKGDRRPRLCVDYRELNKITVRDQYPLPDIQMCIKSLSGGKYFSSLDCNKAFHQIRIYPEDIQKTAFVTPSGKFYEFVRLPFGLHNSPSSYQRVVDLTLSGLKYSEIASFVDDIMVFGSTFEEHNRRLKTVLTRMNNAGFTLRAPKCQIALDKVVFLGQLITRDGIKPAGKLLRSIKEFPVPFDQRSVRAFLGLVGFFRKYCENFARISKPLVDLTKENIKFEWNEIHENAFKILRRKLMNKPILAHYDPKLLTRLDCDASLTGISGILMQHHENGYKPIGFYSRLLHGAEKNYAIYDLEVLAVVQSLKHFRDMLWGIKFILYTDNQAVSYVKNKKDLIGRLARARMDMEEYEFEIYYKPGALNGAADCLSRYPIGWKLIDEKYEKPTINNIICFSGNLNIKELIHLQKEDRNLKTIIDMMKNQEALSKKKLKFVSKFSLQNDVLYKQVFLNGCPKMVICIPEKLRFDVLRNYHDLLPNAHLGYFKTMNKIKERFWWKNMDNFIRQYLRTCDLCERRKVPRTKPSGLAQPIVVHDKWEYVGLDFKGPLKKSKGFEFIIVLTCSFTKYAIAKPTRKADAKTVAKFLFYDVMCTYGCPKVIITDRAQCFMGKVFKEFNKLLGIKHVKSSGFHPTTNSITERFNDVLGVCLTMYCNKNQTNWSDMVLPVVFGYNSARHPITKYSPYELMFGRLPTLPTDINLQLNEMRISNIHQFNKSQMKYMIKISNEVRERIQIAQSKNKKYFDAKHKDVVFDVGDMVLIQNKTIVPETSQKLIPKYIGPYKILEQISPVLYKLDFIPKVNQSNIFHVSRLKKYFDRKEFIKAMEIDEGKLKNFENIEKSLKIQKKIKQPFKSSKLTDNEITEKRIQYKIVSESDSDSEFNPKELPEDNTIINTQPVNNSRIEIDLDARTESEQSELEQSELEQTSEESSLNETDYQSSNSQQSNDGEGEQQTLRRSTRTRRPIDRWNYTMMITCIICLFTNQVFGLSERDPIIWRKTSRKVVEGSTEVSLIINFETPCNIFKRFNLLIDNNVMNELLEWCNDSFENDFMEPLSKLCKRVDILEENRIVRSKRFAIVGAIIAVTIVVTAIVGVTSYAIVKTQENERERIRMQKEFNIAYQEIEKLKRTRDLQTKAMQIINNVLMNLTSQVHEIEVDYNKFKKQTPTTIKLIAFLTTKFHYIKSVLKQTKRMANRKKFNSEFLEMFNVTIECEEEKCPSNHWTYQSCRYDDMRKIIEIKFNMKMFSKDLHIIKADPFDLIKVEEKPNGFILCHSQYNGPRAVLFADKLGCVIPYKIWDSKQFEYENVHLVKEKFKCDPEFIDAGKKNLFGLKNCEEIERFEPTEVIQIKQLGEFNYIYCSFFNITIYKKTIICPDFVFAINSNESFQIGDLKYDAKQIKQSFKVRFDPTWTSTINHQLNPHMKSDLYNGYFKKIEEMINEMNEIASEDNVSLITIIFGRSYTIIGIISFIVLCASIICLCRYYKWFKQWEIRKRESREENPIELSNRTDNQNKERLEEMSVDQRLECNRTLYKKKPRFSGEKFVVHDLPSALLEEMGLSRTPINEQVEDLSELK